jgi:hypothetical protein
MVWARGCGMVAVLTIGSSVVFPSSAAVRFVAHRARMIAAVTLHAQRLHRDKLWITAVNGMN